MSLRGSLVGKAGLVGGVVLAGYMLSKLIRKIPGWDKAFEGLGASIADAFGAGGEPAPLPKAPGAFRFIRKEARGLRASGLSEAATTAALIRRHPGIAPSDIRSLTGGIVINGGLHLHGVQNVPQLEDQLQKRSNQRPQTRRGPGI